MSRYPPLHRLLLRSTLLVTWPAVRAVPERFGFETVEGMQLLGRGVSVLLALATLLLVFRLAERFGDRTAGWLSALFWLGAAPQAYYAKTMNLDAPYVAWFALSLHYFVDFRQRGRRRDLVGFALAGGAAILTKDQAYGLYVLPTLAIFWWIFAAARTRGGGIGRALRALLLDGRLRTAAAALALEFAVVYRVWNGFQEVADHVGAITGQRWMGRFQEVPNTLSGHLQLAVSSWKNLVFCLGWAGAIVCVLAIARELVSRRAAGRSASRLAELLLFPLSYYLTFISVVRYSYDRFLLPVALVLAVFSGRLLASFVRSPRSVASRALAVSVSAIVLCVGIARSAIVDLSMLWDVRLQAEAAVEGGFSVGVAGLGAQLPKVSEQAPIQRYRKRACEALLGVDFLVFQPTYSDGEFGRIFSERLESGAYGFRRVPLNRFDPPGWLYDVAPASTNLAWINMPTWVYRRDPAAACGGAPRQLPGSLNERRAK